jgi:solute carrier family 25 (adenine nucleotide translocator) protein 4/5/6/31
MMMTSGEKVHYKGMVDCGSQIVKAEGVAVSIQVQVIC